MIDEWNESMYACFAHFSEADTLAGGYNHARATGEVPDVQLTAGGAMAFLESAAR